MVNTASLPLPPPRVRCSGVDPSLPVTVHIWPDNPPVEAASFRPKRLYLRCSGMNPHRQVRSALQPTRDPSKSAGEVRLIAGRGPSLHARFAVPDGPNVIRKNPLVRFARALEPSAILIRGPSPPLILQALPS